MAHFAKIENNIVINTIVIDDADCLGGVFPESESVGQQYIASLGLDGEWLQTGDEIRKQYGYVGCAYDPDADVFIALKPFDSWVLDENHDWKPPTPMPSDDKMYRWNEADQEWEQVAG
jgi:hypothetical protein